MVGLRKQHGSVVTFSGSGKRPQGVQTNPLHTIFMFVCLLVTRYTYVYGVSCEAGVPRKITPVLS